MTTRFLEIVCWQPVLTDHQAFTLDELRCASERKVTVYVSKQRDAVRSNQGWKETRVESLEIVTIPAKGWISLVRRRVAQHQNAVHLFGSPFEDIKIMICLLLVIMSGARVYLISEPYSPLSVGYLEDRYGLLQWIKAKLRPVIYQIYGAFLRGRTGGVFAISPSAVRQYQDLGFPQQIIFPFGYFVPSTQTPQSHQARALPNSSPTLRLVFVGSLIARKGLNVLIDALKILDRADVTLDIFGPGNIENYSLKQSNMRYCGQIPFGHAQEVIAKYDLLVLPSRYDGWGVVVNEALMAGVPVICSSAVGAGAIIRKWRCGMIFESDSAAALAHALRNVSLDRELLPCMRHAAMSASAVLTPSTAALYMLEVFDEESSPQGLRPCPWYDC